MGTVLKGKWTLERLLGVGGMAAVYAGHHKIGRHDAIKILHPDIARQPDLKRRFEIEATATNRFHHSGAVEIRDFDVTDDGCPFMVMEMLDGESLGERARRLGEIKEADVLRYADELLDVLAAAHKEGIVHRDIKLDNIFITKDDHVKVLDFGIARIVSSAPLTMQGMRLGTTAYMPPEQLKGQDIDGRADLFAVGATMFRLLAKRRIHEAGSDAEMVVKMSRDPAPKIRDVAPSVSPNAAFIVDRALAFQASDRYPSAHTMQEDVRAVRAERPPSFAVARASALPSLGGTAFEPTGVATAVGAATPGPGFAAPPTSASEATRRELPQASPAARTVVAPAPPPAVSPTVAFATPTPVVAPSVARTTNSSYGLLIAIGVGGLAVGAAIAGYFLLRSPSESAAAAQTATASAAPPPTATVTSAADTPATPSPSVTQTAEPPRWHGHPPTSGRPPIAPVGNAGGPTPKHS